MRRVAIFVVTLGLAAIAAAGEPPRIDGNGGAIEKPPTGTSEVADEATEPRVERLPGIDHRSILLDLRSLESRASRSQSLLDEMLPDEDAPGSLARGWGGLYSIAIRRARGYYRNFFSDTMRDRWNGTSMSVFEFDRAFQRMSEAEGDLQAGGAWWRRTWRQSLVPEKGGAPAFPRFIRTGYEIEVFRLGEVALTTEGKIRLGRLSIYLDDDRIYQSLERSAGTIFRETTSSRVRSEANLARVAGPPLPETAKEKERDKEKEKDKDERRLDLSLGFAEDDAQVDLDRVLAGRESRRTGPRGTPRGNLYTGDGWNLSARPTLTLRMPDGTSIASAFSVVAVQIDLQLYPGSSRKLFGVISLRIRAEPRADTASATLDFELIKW